MMCADLREKESPYHESRVGLLQTRVSHFSPNSLMIASCVYAFGLSLSVKISAHSS